MSTWTHTTASPSCIDADGNEYSIVKIGSRVWMAENLKVTHYNNGTEIPTGYSNSEWADLDETETGAYAVYYNNESNADTYGNLYNWHAVDDSRGIAPDGWHIPTDEEWTILITHLDEDATLNEDGTQSYIAGGMMKEEGFEHWASPNTGATNESGFTALPGGYREYLFGGYSGKGYLGYFWSSTENDSNGAWSRILRSVTSGIYRGDYRKNDGISVRCIKDDESQINLWSTLFPLLKWHAWENETTDNWESWG